MRADNANANATSNNTTRCVVCKARMNKREGANVCNNTCKVRNHRIGKLLDQGTLPATIDAAAIIAHSMIEANTPANKRDA